LADHDISVRVYNVVHRKRLDCGERNPHRGRFRYVIAIHVKTNINHLFGSVTLARQAVHSLPWLAMR